MWSWICPLHCYVVCNYDIEGNTALAMDIVQYCTKPSICRMKYKAASRLAPSQRETSLQSNAVSHWLGANLEAFLEIYFETLFQALFLIKPDQLDPWFKDHWTSKRTAFSGRVKPFHRMTSSNGHITALLAPALWWESTGHRWISLTKVNDAELWRFLWSTPEQTFQQTIETQVI